MRTADGVEEGLTYGENMQLHVDTAYTMAELKCEGA